MEGGKFMSEKLKPCPFCGSEAELFEAPGVYFVECSNPKCNYPTNWDTKEEAITAWNTRALTPQQEHADELFSELENWVKKCEVITDHLSQKPEKYNGCYLKRKALIEKIKEVQNEI